MNLFFVAISENYERHFNGNVCWNWTSRVKNLTKLNETQTSVIFRVVPLRFEFTANIREGLWIFCNAQPFGSLYKRELPVSRFSKFRMQRRKITRSINTIFYTKYKIPSHSANHGVQYVYYLASRSRVKKNWNQQLATKFLYFSPRFRKTSNLNRFHRQLVKRSCARRSFEPDSTSK